MDPFQLLQQQGFGGFTGPTNLVAPNQQVTQLTPQGALSPLGVAVTPGATAPVSPFSFQDLAANREATLNQMLGHRGGTRRNMDGSVQDMNAPRGLDALRPLAPSWEGAQPSGPISRPSTPQEIALLDASGNSRTDVGMDGRTTIMSPFGIATNAPDAAVVGAPTINVPAANGSDGSPMLGGELAQLRANLEERARSNIAAPYGGQDQTLSTTNLSNGRDAAARTSEDATEYLESLLGGPSRPAINPAAAATRSISPTQTQRSAPTSPFTAEQDMAFVDAGGQGQTRVPGNERFWQMLGELFSSLQPRI